MSNTGDGNGLKTVTITLTGTFTNRAVSVDDEEQALSGFGGGAQSVTLRGISVGRHKLTWSVDGEPDAGYTVAISGDTDPWARTFEMVEGTDDGNKRFTVK